MASLQDQPVLAVQQCSVSTGAPAGARFVAGYPSHLPSAVQVQGCSSGAGQAMGTLVSGVVGLRSASFSGVSPFAHEAAPAAQASLQPCSVYVHSSYAGCNQLLQPMSPGVAVDAPGVQRSMRCADPRYRRMSADSPGFKSVTVPRVPAAALSAYPDSSSMTGNAGPQVASAARMGSGPLPALATGAAAAAGLPSQHKAQAGAGMAAGRRSMDVHRSASAAAAGESDPVGMLCAVAAPSWAGPSWHPKADLDSTQPAKKGTGVFMPRNAA